MERLDSPQIVFDWLTPSVSVNGDTGQIDRFAPGPAVQLSGYESLFCLGDALKETGLSFAFDAVGLIPEVEGVTRVIQNARASRIARAVGNKAGYRGVVATQYGIKAVHQGKTGTGLVSLAFGLDDRSKLGRISTAVTIAGFIPLPGVSTGSAVFGLALDAAKTNHIQSECMETGKYN